MTRVAQRSLGSMIRGVAASAVGTLAMDAWLYRDYLHDGGETAAVLINAMLKGTYAPVALPKREFMEEARGIWERLGLPPLTPQTPWHGYDLGHWPAELERQAAMAVRSDYFAMGDELERQRRADVAMNAPVKHE